MVVMGLAIALTWARDMRSSPEVDRSAGLLRARDRRDGSLFLPHWIAEYATSLGLVAGGIGLIADAGWAEGISLVALGALTYTSVNSLGWTLALRFAPPVRDPDVGRRDRRGPLDRRAARGVTGSSPPR